MTTICKAFVFILLIFEALAFPPENGYDDYDYESEWKAHISELPTPEFMEQAQRIVAKEGESAVIPCNLKLPSQLNSFVLIITKLPIPEKGQPEKLLYVGVVRVPRDPERRYKNVDGKLEILDLKREDAGPYLCRIEAEPPVEVTHVLDIQSDDIVQQGGNPKIPIITSDENGGEETTYTLTWTTESFYPITNYRLKYRKAKVNDSIDVPGDWTEQIYQVDAEQMTVEGLINSMEHKIENLEAATDYNASVQVKNQYMWSDSADFSFSTRKGFFKRILSNLFNFFGIDFH